MTRLFRFARLLFAAALAGLLLSPAALAAFPGQNGKIAFNHDAFSNDQVWTINPDGTGLQQLTFTGRNSDPAWSADGRRIAFTSDRDGNEEIYVMDADGANQRRVTTDPAHDSGPTWSPDGRRIAFTHWGGTDAAGIYVANADGGGLTNLTNGQGGGDPAWSPDGRQIAFVSSSNVFVMNTDGTGRVQLTNNPPPSRSGFRSPGDPDWSPDGTQITYDLLFGGDSHFFNSIQVMNADGSNDTEHFFGPSEFLAGPVFSPDGAHIVFHCNGGLCVMAAGGPVCCDPPPSIPGTTGRDWQPDWQPVVPGPQRDDYKNARRFCKAERAFLGRAEFRRKYGRHAFASCVRQNRGRDQRGRDWDDDHHGRDWDD
jgi:Tol biopolymer transport system component